MIMHIIFYLDGMQGRKVVSPYVGLARKQDGGSNGSSSDYTTYGSECYALRSAFLSFSSAALANEMANIARQQGQSNKVATSQNAILFFFFLLSLFS